MLIYYFSPNDHEPQQPILDGQLHPLMAFHTHTTREDQLFIGSVDSDYRIRRFARSVSASR